MNNIEDTKPRPGSKKAVSQGCLCPVVDNHFGKGVPGLGYWMNADCPIHGQKMTAIIRSYIEGKHLK